MNKKGTIKKIIIALFVAIGVLVIFSMMQGNQGMQTGGSSSLSSMISSGTMGQVQEANTALANAEILRILGNIQTINLNIDIFANPVFRQLHDSRFSIPRPTHIGRPNPFLPIGFDTIAVIQQPAPFENNQPGFFDEFQNQLDDTSPQVF